MSTAWSGDKGVEFRLERERELVRRLAAAGFRVERLTRTRDGDAWVCEIRSDEVDLRVAWTDPDRLGAVGKAAAWAEGRAGRS